MKKYIFRALLYGFWATSVPAIDIRVPAVIPLPQKMECHDGTFQLTPATHIFSDSASEPTTKFLAERLRTSTGYPLETELTPSPNTANKGGILFTTKDANTNLGTEGYELIVAPDSVVLRAPTQAGLFYGAQTLLQLFPTEIFSPKRMTNADWQMSCVHIEDWPRFKWRGLMLDVSRHFYGKPEIEVILDAMAAQKLNVFHWHLTDDQGWRIEIKKYPKLTEVGAWRKSIGFGLSPQASQAYDAAGRYGGFYTSNDIREVMAYAAARHITVVPEIEMPGHSLAALTAYPQLSCTGGPFSMPLDLGIFNGIYCPAKAETFQFLQNVLTEVFQLFPGQYIHIGGDEVPKDDWEKSLECQQLMRREGLKNEDKLQSWFIRRIEKFVNARGRTLIGWSEILQGGLATNAVVMDWIGGGAEAARAGHDVVMTPQQFCYLCYYPSLDRPPDLRAYRPCLPLNQVYAFEPIPTTLEAQYRFHILGAEVCVWTPDIPSMSELEQMIFPRLSAFAEDVWSSKTSRNWNDFSNRLDGEYQRLAISGINYWKDQAVEIGRWMPAQISGQDNLLEWNATKAITAPGKYRLSLNYMKGKNGLQIKWVALLENGHEIDRDIHPGFTGTTLRGNLMAYDWNYFFDLPTFKQGARYTIQTSTIGNGGNDSSGVVFLEKK
jgi:hexosaminidase